MKVIIGLCGVKRSGKNTVANMISEFSKISESSLAGKLKDVTAQVFDFDRKLLDDDKLKEVPFETPYILTEENIGNALSGFKVEFTDELKQKLGYLVGMEINTPRKGAQIIGTDVLRAAGDPEIHCKNMYIDPRFDTTVITDIRFLNEYDYFDTDKHLFVPVFVRRPTYETKTDAHPSEMEMYEIFKTKPGYYIVNDGSLADLERKVFVLINNIRAAQDRKDIRFYKG